MRQAFTETLREAINRADDEARALNQEFVGLEHLLLGLLFDPTSEAGRILQSSVEPNELRKALLAKLPTGSESPLVSGRLPLSPKAQRAINNGVVNAQAAGETNVATRFILLALLDEPQTAIRQVLSSCGADVDQLQNSLANRPVEVEA